MVRFYLGFCLKIPNSCKMGLTPHIWSTPVHWQWATNEQGKTTECTPYLCPEAPAVLHMSDNNLFLLSRVERGCLWFLLLLQGAGVVPGTLPAIHSIGVTGIAKVEVRGVCPGCLAK